MTAHMLQTLLKSRHSKDVYVPECKNGSTWFQNHLRLDGLAIARSWANPVVTGYEIKVSRSDFMADEKWHMYLDYCNLFYFVCPSGLISPEELPENIGLLWASKNGARLYKKKKACYRDIDIPSELYKYILISRAEIKEYRYDVAYDRTEFWEHWLVEREYNKEFGRRVSGAVSRALVQKIEQVETDNKKLVEENQEYAEIKELLVEAGIDIKNRWGLKRNVDRKLQELHTSIPDGMAQAIETCIRNLTEFKGRLG